MRLDLGDLRRDIGPSLVVFLIALPLSLGIALASGAPPIAGLIAAAVGGVVVGALGGSPLQVTGPAAGLAVIVYQFVERFGWEQTCIVTAIGGLIQIAGGALRLGDYARAIAPPVVKGMLAAIGILIAVAQAHVLLGGRPPGDGIANFLGLPSAVRGAHGLAVTVGLVTLVVAVAWPRLARGRLNLVPTPLVAVLVGTGLALLERAFGAPDAATLPRIVLPEGGVAGMISVPDPRAVTAWPAVLGAAFALAVIASVESLLTAAAADRMQSFAPRTSYNRELAAQGAGNLLSGALGGLPLSGVIVRTSANIHAGARSRWSAILHGAWVILALAAIPFAIEEVPLSALAALLVLTGVKLANPREARALWAARPADAAVYGVTLVAVVATDLLTGIAAGFAAALVRLGWDVFKVRIEHHEIGEGKHRLTLAGIATFLHLPRLARALERVPPHAEVVVETDGLHYMDEGVRDHLERWKAERRRAPGGMASGARA